MRSDYSRITGSYTHEQNTEPQKIQLYVFLFSDIILWTREKNGQYKLVIPPARITNISEQSRTNLYKLCLL